MSPTFSSGRQRAINDNHIYRLPLDLKEFKEGLVAMILWNFFTITGLGKGTPTVAIPQLRNEANFSAGVSTDMVSWLSSTSAFSGSISIFIIIPIGHFMGRKFTMVVLSITTLIVSTIIYFSKTAIHLLICQLILGLTSAAECSVFLLILTEYSSPKYRGVFLTIKSASLFWGIWIANTIGIFTHYQYIGLVGILCSIYSLIISFIIPESPFWLAFRGRYAECAVAHRWLKGVDKDAEKELDVLIKSQKEIFKSKTSVKSLQKHFKLFFTALKQPVIFKPILLCCLVSSILIFSGKMVCTVYAIQMMKKIFVDQSTVNMSVLIIDGFTVFGMYIGCGLSKILKRRTLLLSTSIIGTTFIFVMCIYLYLIKFSLLPENDYVIIAMLVGYSVAVCCGPNILSTSISAELLPIRFRSLCVLIFSMYTLMIYSIILKVSPYLYNSIGFKGVYLGFGVCSIILIILFYKYVPETKDRTLHEIEEIFRTKEKRETQSKLLDSN